ncbi:hypothetical protein LCGC14_1635170 [marine sediment metagenome]|uniref:HK97 gp10 family phage protein n=1 Tax=marine sediment metagenome TaxID=412755 RepID=A0A0F9I1N5_9ZZZZ
MRAHLEFDTRSLKEFELKVLDSIGFQVVNEIKRKIREIPLIDTGQFINSIHHRITNEGLIIEDGVFYGKFLEFGTTAHFVAPKTKKALRWEEGRKGRLAARKSPKDAKIRFSKGHMVRGIQAHAPFRKGIQVALKNLRV